jgi:hypothetical protein
MIKNNGWISEEVLLKRGIKQGCPLSALLFILVAEVLSLSIKQSREYKGLGIRNSCIKILQYADDTIVFPNSDNDVTEVINILNKFAKVAGTKLNIEKTEGLRLGKFKHENITNTKIKWNNKCIRCLGIYVGLDKAMCEKKNWLDKITEMQKLLDTWRKRKLTLFGKVQVIKTLALSKLVFSATNTYTPDHIYKSINDIIFSYLWTKGDRIKRNVVIGPVKHGGLSMPDIELFFKSLKATWVHKLFTNQDATWSTVAMKCLDNIGPFHWILKTNFIKVKQFPIISKIPVFYQQVLLSYNLSKPLPKLQNGREIQDQSIWGNTNLTVYNKKSKMHECMYYKSWIKQDILFVKDLPLSHGNIDTTSIMARLKGENQIIMQLYTMINVLRPYKNTFCNMQGIEKETSNTSIMHSKSKDIYIELLQKKVEIAKFTIIKNCIKSDITTDKIESIFMTKVVKIYENKIAEFNYKILHGILVCGNLVSKWDSDIDKNCDICNQKETIEHMIWLCSIARFIWNLISNALDLLINDADIIIGVKNCNELNEVLSIIAYTIYKYRLQSWENGFIRTKSGAKLLLRSDLLYYYKINKCMDNFKILTLLDQIIKCII